MGTNARKGRRRPKNKASRYIAGKFFEHLALTIVGGELTDINDQELGDIVNDRLSFGVEVKASDSHSVLGLRLEQKIGYEKVMQAGFPLDHFAYILFCYTNDDVLRVRDGKPRPLSRFKSTEAKYRFLAKDLKEVYLLDLRIIDSLEKKVGTKQCRHPGREGELDISLRRRDLKPFVNGSSDAYLLELGLDPSDWVRGSYVLANEVNVEEDYETQTFNSKFPLITILHKDFHPLFVVERDLNLTIAKAPSL